MHLCVILTFALSCPLITPLWLLVHLEAPSHRLHIVSKNNANCRSVLSEIGKEPWICQDARAFLSWRDESVTFVEEWNKILIHGSELSCRSGREFGFWAYFCLRWIDPESWCCYDVSLPFWARFFQWLYILVGWCTIFISFLPQSRVIPFW